MKKIDSNVWFYIYFSPCRGLCQNLFNTIILNPIWIEEDDWLCKSDKDFVLVEEDSTCKHSESQVIIDLRRAIGIKIRKI